MASEPNSGIQVTFVGLAKDQDPPDLALYELDEASGAPRKLAQVVGGALDINPDRLKGMEVALGPNVEGDEAPDPTLLMRFRGDQVMEDWGTRGILLPADRWTSFLREMVCVSGRVRKCRPWWWEYIVTDRVKLSDTFGAGTKLGVQKRALPQSIADSALGSIVLPWRCVPICEGIVEVFERVCCCHWIIYDDLLDRLREVLKDIPIEIRWPPIPDPDPGPLAWRVSRAGSPASGAALQSPDLTRTTVPERLFNDYQALLQTPRDQVEAFVTARSYLSGLVCNCTSRKVGEVFIRPGGEFDFCYWRWPYLRAISVRCHTTHAYRVKQLIGGVWTVVYDGLSASDYFALGEEAVLTTSHPQARPCGDGPPPPDPGDGTPFVMLEHVTGAGTHHFNFPFQTGLSQVGALGASSGLYDFGAPDCPWAVTLGLRLWVSPTLEGVVSYYRFKVVRVTDAGTPVGTPDILSDAVAWQRYVTVPGDVITTSTGLAANPADVGGQEGLFTVPYWSGGMNWLSGQYHQSWNTTAHADGKYLLILELFGPDGTRIKPNGAPGSDPGDPEDFQLRRWEAPGDTANVPFADCAHVFWINNTPVTGDIVDLRRNGLPSTDECQFMSGPGPASDPPGTTTFSTGFRAYHLHGVTTGGGPGDTNSFMRSYSLVWQRGLNGPSGSLETGTADQGELAVEPSATIDFATLLGAFPPSHGAHRRCTFSIHLHVDAKHHNGASFIDAYDYHETAAFALELTP